MISLEYQKHPLFTSIQQNWWNVYLDNRKVYLDTLYNINNKFQLPSDIEAPIVECSDNEEPLETTMPLMVVRDQPIETLNAIPLHNIVVVACDDKNDFWKT